MLPQYYLNVKHAERRTFYSRLIVVQMKLPGFLFSLYLFDKMKLVHSIVVYMKLMQAEYRQG